MPSASKHNGTEVVYQKYLVVYKLILKVFAVAHGLITLCGSSGYSHYETPLLLFLLKLQQEFSGLYRVLRAS